MQPIDALSQIPVWQAQALAQRFLPRLDGLARSWDEVAVAIQIHVIIGRHDPGALLQFGPGIDQAYKALCLAVVKGFGNTAVGDAGRFHRRDPAMDDHGMQHKQFVQHRGLDIHYVLLGGGKP